MFIYHLGEWSRETQPLKDLAITAGLIIGISAYIIGLTSLVELAANLLHNLPYSVAGTMR